jgi:hypothetical protein
MPHIRKITEDEKCMKAIFVEDDLDTRFRYIAGLGFRQVFESKKIPYAYVQVGIRIFIFTKDFAEWLVETQPFEKKDAYKDYAQFAKLINDLIEENPKYASQLHFIFVVLTYSFAKERIDHELFRTYATTTAHLKLT